MSRSPIKRKEGDLFFATGAVLAGLGVIAGAFGTHLLSQSLSDTEKEVWRTATNYQLYHALAVIVVARLLAHHPTRFFRAACGCFVLGILLFSGSLYAIALSGQPSMGLITPLGGIAFLAGWISLAVGIFRTDS
jgi:uncharacterized membrane protein YgdD (TMEM256/DUF423 family)